MSGRILDSGRIQALTKQGWSVTQIAQEIGCPWQSVAHSLRQDREWDDDPGLRARWKKRLPAMKKALRAEIKRCGIQPAKAI